MKTCGLCRHYYQAQCAAPVPMWVNLSNCDYSRLYRSDKCADKCQSFSVNPNLNQLADEMIRENKPASVIASATGKSEEAIRLRRYRLRKAGKL